MTRSPRSLCIMFLLEMLVTRSREESLPSSKGGGEAAQSIGATVQAWKQMFNLSMCKGQPHTGTSKTKQKPATTNTGSQCYSSPDPLSVQSVQLIITMQAA